jgi:signal transduction histidine kinase
MAFSFIGLLYLQVQYIVIIPKTTKEQFESTVRRCLNNVSNEIEKQEVIAYMEKISNEMGTNFISLNTSYPQKFSQKMETVRMRYVRGDSTSSVLGFEQYESVLINQSTQNAKTQRSPESNKSAIIESSEKSEREYVERYFRLKAIQEQVQYVLSQTAYLTPIENRIDLFALKKRIAAEFENNGLTLPFVLTVVNNHERIVFQSEPLSKKPESSDIITQVIFPADPASRMNYIKVYFPTKASSLSESVMFFVPSVFFSIILLITFTITIYIIFRQKKLSEMKTDFVNNMTHELKTPVSTISIAAQMMKDSDISKSPEVFKHISSVINDETKRLGFLVEKVLQMSLFENQKASLKLKEIDINDLITSVANTFTIKVEKSGGQIDVDLKAENSTIYADQMHITNMLFNLLDNAVKYRRETVPLSLMVRTRNDGDKVMISVEDNGIGIKKEYLKKVFDRFFRVPTGNVHNVKGFGLGLAYVHKVAADHLGSIRAENGRGNIGTTFIITLPTINN